LPVAVSVNLSGTKAMSLMLANTQISVWSGFSLSSGWNCPLMVNWTSRSLSGSDGFGRMVFDGLVKVCRFCGMNWFCPRWLWTESGPAYQFVKNSAPLLVFEKFTGARLGLYVPSASWLPSGGLSVLTHCSQ
jgi:hypothetical protein